MPLSFNEYGYKTTHLIFSLSAGNTAKHNLFGTQFIVTVLEHPFHHICWLAVA